MASAGPFPEIWWAADYALSATRQKPLSAGRLCGTRDAAARNAVSHDPLGGGQDRDSTWHGAGYRRPGPIPMISGPSRPVSRRRIPPRLSPVSLGLLTW